MKIEIYFLNSKLTTEIKKDIQVKDLIYNIKQYLKSENSNYILFDDKYNSLKETDTISIKQKNQLTFYLVKSKKSTTTNPEKKEDKVNMSELIMKCTGAKKPLQGRFRLVEINGLNVPGRDNNAFERLINILQAFEDINQMARNEQINNNNNPVEADEGALRELQEMGFAEDRARQALINSRNDVNRATEILLGENGE
jgi:uncharacterized UBP type Zn finger protein